MSKKQEGFMDWELPSIYDIIDRMSFSWLFGEEKTEPEPAKKKKKTRKKASKKKKGK
jgi:hypothetical protein